MRIMPIIKIIPSTSKVFNIQRYIQNPKKTNSSLYLEHECCAKTAAKDFNLMRKIFKKKDGRTYYHIIISWNSQEDNITTEDCCEMTREICEESGLKDYPYFAAIHTDTEHLHAHIVVNNINIRTGKSFQSTKQFREDIMQIANKISKSRGYHRSVIDTKQKSKTQRSSAEIAISIKKNKMPWKDTLRSMINEALLKAENHKEFVRLMLENAVDIELDKNGEYKFLPYELYEDPNRMKPCHSRRLGTKYSKENIEKAFQKNLNTRIEAERMKKLYETLKKNSKSR